MFSQNVNVELILVRRGH